MIGFVLNAPWIWVPLFLAGSFAIGFLGAPVIAWTALGLTFALGLALPWPLLVLAVAVALVANVSALRMPLVSGPILRLFKALKFLPTISQTEREALEAGTVWADGELFSGKPNFESLLANDYPGLTPEEQSFLDGPVEEVCRMTDDWQAWQERDLTKEVWQYLKDHGFFGMIIPESYGGLGFSASATVSYTHLRAHGPY